MGEIIAEAGVEGLTMRKLAERANVAVATLYNQFGDRNGVLVAFVGNGLDQLEGELDAGPPADPVDTTRALFEALDQTVAAREAVWRSVFAVLKSGPSVHGMGPLGDRVVTFIQHDLEKAAVAGRLVDGCDVERLARHVFTTRMNRLEKWAVRAIDWEQYRRSSTLGLELTLAAVLVEPHRHDALRRSGVLD